MSNPKKSRPYVRKPKPAPASTVLTDTWCTTAEVARYFRIGIRCLYYWIDNGLIAISKIGKKILINKADVEQLLQANRNLRTFGKL